jgi:hypothetical protein
MQYYSVIKKNEIMLFAGKWMKLESIILRGSEPGSEGKDSMFSLICRSHT